MYIPRDGAAWSVTTSELPCAVPVFNRYGVHIRTETMKVPAGSYRKYKSALVRSDFVTPTNYGRVTITNVCTPSNPVKTTYRNGDYYIFPRAWPIDPPDTFWDGGNKSYGVLLKWSTNLRNRVRTEALANFASDDLSLSSTFAELGETVGYLADKAGTLFGAIKAIKSGNLRQLRKYIDPRIKGRSIPTNVASRYLEYKYAIKPLVLEVQGLMNVVDGSLTESLQPDQAFTILAKSVVKVPITDTVRNFPWVHSQSLEAMYTCKLYATVDDVDMRLAAKSGLTNIPGGIWELVPFSFVIDWAIPIGTFLQAVNSTRGLKFHHGYESLRINGVVTSKNISVDYGTCDSYVRAFERQKLLSFPAAMPYVKSPLSTGNVASALALFQSIFRR